MKYRVLLLFTIGILNNAFSQQTKPLSKEQLTNLYFKLYQSSEVDSIAWDGDVRKCDCGKLEEVVYKKAQDRINFFRIVCGLREVTINPKFNQDAQNAALLTKANNQLTHYPAKELKCYSQSASNGCVKSCLGFSDFKNFRKTSFITGFINDYGTANYYVGHRKWVLYSKLKEFGYGATNRSEALLTVDGVSRDSIPLPEYIAYPWEGYVPVDLIFPKWSFSIPENKVVDFSNVVIAVTTDKGREIEIEKLEERKNYLDNTIVWITKGLFSDYDIHYGLNKMEENGFLNKKIKVSIKNIKINGSIKNYEYSVVPLKISNR